MAEPLPANGQILLAYKKDEETSFTTIFTWNTNSELYHEAINIESSGAAFPEFREITFRVECVGQTAGTTGDPAVLTGVKYKWEPIASFANSLTRRRVSSLKGRWN